ncbi:exopolysaccharide biosynthesis polyprenyl glycosylphosphotransferase [Flavobacterium sp. NKUCC04_CG]|uniref:exopolysaccharide biosynthesis polyprenyl glycosylphosphotransferase n=1 Tax=Flavobacterium sp. NKUCC04_CG TaxID=2842121 RepID=UPI001C5B95DF|nr:exopolysaccharide biosynthesis polyprenyl glycosylphosphotransferase [Flavobacterium sp. NKUCC04_CG]MBW3518888.1 exopolysaccharide biosynthesis polyprenyl glycosylphosphotransferase [Flavobacterium sp. NKUCC04_CG]
MNKKIGRYSHLIKYIVIGIDLLTMLLFSTWILRLSITSYLSLWLVGSWFLIAFYNEFYKVYRFTSIVTIVQKFLKQLVIYFLCFFASLGFLEMHLNRWDIVSYFVMLSITLFGIKIFIFNILKQYRLSYGGNKRYVMVLGNSKTTQDLVNFFNFNPEYGYYLQEIIEPDPLTNRIDIEQVNNYIKHHGIDEIYCSLKSIDSDQVSTLFNLAKNNFKTIKFIPDNHELLMRKMELQYYGIHPLLMINQSPLGVFSNALVKRVFDLIFSILIIVFVLSWLVPIIGLCIRIDSKGPIFFRQKRNGLNYREFNCYKFRSLYMENTKEEYKPITKRDCRATAVGAFLRRTSLDELPQFFNVLTGDMSVVGPRPHPLVHNLEYTKSVDNFMMRHLIKPGITGMAQTHGYRGEVEHKRDIVNRVKYDIFYIENWSLLLDLKIVFITMWNAFSGDKKAY